MFSSMPLLGGGGVRYECLARSKGRVQAWVEKIRELLRGEEKRNLKETLIKERGGCRYKNGKLWLQSDGQKSDPCTCAQESASPEEVLLGLGIPSFGLV